MSHIGVVRRCCRLSSFRIVTALLVSTFGALIAPDAGAGERAPELGRPGQVVFPEIMGVRSGVPSIFAGLHTGGLFPGEPLSSVGWGGVIGYNEYYGESESRYEGAEPWSQETRSRSFWVTPSMDVFVGRRFSIGASVGVLHSAQAARYPGGSVASEGLSIGASPRIGYLVPIAKGLSFWPRLSIAAAYSHHSVDSAGQYAYNRGVGRALSGGLELALVYQPLQNLIFKVAPQINAGGASSELTGQYQSAYSESAFVRVGGEATVGLVF
jgi:hypothetical protein